MLRLPIGSSLGLIAAAGVLLLVACGGGSSAQENDEATPSATATETETTPATATATPTPTATPTATPTPFNGNVAAMRIPSLDVDAAIESVGLDSLGALEAPHDPLQIGWHELPEYGYGKPGWGLNSVFSAHVDYYPNIIGPFHDITEMQEGDQIIIVMENGTEYVYEFVRHERYTVTEWDGGRVVWPPDRPEDEEWITLITCGGDFRALNDNGSGEYLHRDVVVAKRVA